MSCVIHPTAVVAPEAKLHPDVVIGPFCVIGPQVMLGRGVRLMSHVVVEGQTTIGDSCEIYPFACIGHTPQDKKYRGESSCIEIGHHTVLREYVTVHPGTQAGGMVTRIGSHCLLMGGVHIAHDCHVEDGVTMANYATLGGHVTVGKNAVIGGLAAVHQFVRIGAHAMIGGATGVAGDVAPYGLVQAIRGSLVGLNIVGLKRHGVARDEILALRQAYAHIFNAKGSGDGFATRAATVPEVLCEHPSVQNLRHFFEATMQRALCLPDEEFLENLRREMEEF